MEKREILFLALLIIGIVAWITTLLLYVFPMLSIPLSDILSLSISSLIILGVFFGVWLPLILMGIFILVTEW